MATKHIWARSASSARTKGGGKTVVVTKVNRLKRQPTPPKGKKGLTLYSVTTRQKKTGGRKRKSSGRKRRRKNPKMSKRKRSLAAKKGWRRRKARGR